MKSIPPLAPACLTLALAVLLSVPASGAGAGDVIPFDDEHWDLTGGMVVEHLGRTALAGSAMLRDVSLLDGVVEFDMALDGSRDYPGLAFRHQGQGEYEHIYIRPHNSGKPEALQYAPVFGGASCWQLYHEGYIAPVEIPTGSWVSVRIEIQGRQTRIFFNDLEQPALTVHHLQRDPAAGGLVLTGSRGPATRFSNFRCSADAELHFDPTPEAARTLGLVTDWELSQAYPATRVDMEHYPDDETLAAIEWQPVTTEANGLLNISRHRARTPGGGADAVYARAVITATTAGRVQLAFGYSDATNLFLNGERLFSGSAAYRQRHPSFQGIIGLHDAVDLPLTPGKNELLLMVAESFGGWGLMAQRPNTVFQGDGVKELWEMTRTLDVPESVVHDREREVLYVSNFLSGGISRVSTDGRLLEQTWVSGLARPTGMALQDGSLFVVDRTGLLEIDIQTATVVNRYPVPGGQFINDVAFDDRGRAHVSDSATGTIHRLADGAFTPWHTGGEITAPNGLCTDGGRLIVGDSGDGSLKAVDLEDGTVTTLVSLGQGSVMDGIARDGAGGFIISDFNGRVFRVTPGGEATEILNRTAPGRFCADLEYVPDQDLLVIPSLYDNRLTAYRLTRK